MQPYATRGSFSLNQQLYCSSTGSSRWQGDGRVESIGCYMHPRRIVMYRLHVRALLCVLGAVSLLAGRRCYKLPRATADILHRLDGTLQSHLPI